MKFYSKKAGIEGGRNLDTKKIPFSNVTKTTDLGAREKIIPVTGFVIGESHRNLAQNLISVLDKEGPGILVHPTIGNILVHVHTWSCAEEDSSQGITQFTFQFIQESELIIESDPVPVEESLTAGSEGILAAAGSNFFDNFKVLDMAVDGLENLEKFIQAVTDNIMPAIDFIEDQTKNITRLAFGIRQIREKIKEIINLPNVLFNKLKDAFKNLWGAINNQTFGDSAEGNNTSVFELTEASFASADFPFESDPVSDFSTQSALTETTELIRNTVNIIVLSQITGNLPVFLNDDTPVSGDEIRATQGLIIERLNQVLAATESPEIFRAVLAQRAVVCSYFRQLTGRLRPHTLTEVTPAIVVAYNISGSDNLNELQAVEQELVSRNKIIHPGFVPAAEIIEVLNG
jgi:prophage DNA circulation protein